MFNSGTSLNNIQTSKRSIFLAGSIDFSSKNWRQRVVRKLGDKYLYFDPTNCNYDNLSTQEMENHIKWEFEAMQRADIVLLNLLPNSLSPISLVELGLNIHLGKLLVICPKEFYKSVYVHLIDRR